MLNEIQTISLLKKHPTSYECFHDYIKWLFQNDVANPEKNDLIWALTTEDDTMEYLEEHLNSSMDILNLNIIDFCNVFGFKKELFTSDHEKVHDVLAEPSLAVKLHKHGFKNITKLPKSIKMGNNRLPIADFKATYDSKTYAIELKTIRMEKNAKDSNDTPLGPALIPSWWRTMLKNNINTKIKNKNCKLLKQLQNTCKHYECDYSMLAIYTRRLGPSTLTSKDGYIEDLKAIASEHPQIDSFMLKDYFGETVFYPPLTTK